jgi:hypothetical protein
MSSIIQRRHVVVTVDGVKRTSSVFYSKSSGLLNLKVSTYVPSSGVTFCIDTLGARLLGPRPLAGRICMREGGRGDCCALRQARGCARKGTGKGHHAKCEWKPAQDG